MQVKIILIKKCGRTKLVLSFHGLISQGYLDRFVVLGLNSVPLSELLDNKTALVTPKLKFVSIVALGIFSGPIIAVAHRIDCWPGILRAFLSWQLS